LRRTVTLSQVRPSRNRAQTGGQWRELRPLRSSAFSRRTVTSTTVEARCRQQSNPLDLVLFVESPGGDRSSGIHRRCGIFRWSRTGTRLFVRIASACAAVLRGIVSPCRWCEFVEPTTPKKPVETTQVNIECAFRGCPGRLQDSADIRRSGTESSYRSEDSGFQRHS
jgi:hypothetical protein